MIAIIKETVDIIQIILFSYNSFHPVLVLTWGLVSSVTELDGFTYFAAGSIWLPCNHGNCRKRTLTTYQIAIWVGWFVRKWSPRGLSLVCLLASPQYSYTCTSQSVAPKMATLSGIPYTWSCPYNYPFTENKSK